MERNWCSSFASFQNTTHRLRGQWALWIISSQSVWDNCCRWMSNEWNESTNTISATDSIGERRLARQCTTILIKSMCFTSDHDASKSKRNMIELKEIKHCPYRSAILKSAVFDRSELIYKLNTKWKFSQQFSICAYILCFCVCCLLIEWFNRM